MSNKWIFIIDTDSYAGNFERDMCAYVTGVVGGCTVGEEYAALYHKEAKKKELFYDCLEHRSDDSGCARPTECWPTKGWLSVGYDGAVREEDWNQEVADKAYQKANVAIYEGYLKQTEAATVGQNGWTEESKATQIARQKKEIKKASKEKAPKTNPNNSVAIFFETEPTKEMISIMKERAFNFAAAKRKIAHDEDLSWDKNFTLTIHGFRLEEEVTKSKSRKV